MDNNNIAASICINILFSFIATFEAQKPLSEAYNNQCRLVKTIECLVQDQLNKPLKQP